MEKKSLVPGTNYSVKFLLNMFYTLIQQHIYLFGLFSTVKNGNSMTTLWLIYFDD